MSSAAVNMGTGSSLGALSLQEAAERVGVAATTLRRWAREGLVPPYDGSWTAAAVSHARIVARLRELGHSLRQIRRASERAAWPSATWKSCSTPARRRTRSSRRHGRRDSSAHWSSGCWGHSARCRPRRSGSRPRTCGCCAIPPALRRAGRGRAHGVRSGRRRDRSGADAGRYRLRRPGGYTRLTEEAGELEAVDAVERFVDAVESTLPDDARVIKTIGDEAMIVGSDLAGLTEWAVAFQRLQEDRTLPRIAIHYGNALYRDGDYYGRDVNIASRVSARAAGGEVLVTRPVVERARGELEFDKIAEVRLKGFTESTEVFIARGRAGG